MALALRLGNHLWPAGPRPHRRKLSYRLIWLLDKGCPWSACPRPHRSAHVLPLRLTMPCCPRPARQRLHRRTGDCKVLDKTMVPVCDLSGRSPVAGTSLSFPRTVTASCPQYTGLRSHRRRLMLKVVLMSESVRGHPTAAPTQLGRGSRCEPGHGDCRGLFWPWPHRRSLYSRFSGMMSTCPRPARKAPSQALVVPVVRRGPSRCPRPDWPRPDRRHIVAGPIVDKIVSVAGPRPHRRTTQYRPDDLASATVRGLPGHGPIAATSVKRGLPGAWSVRGLHVTAPSWCACAYILGGANQTCPSPARSQPNRSDWIPGTRQILAGRVRSLPGRGPIVGP